VEGKEGDAGFLRGGRDFSSTTLEVEKKIEVQNR